MKVIIAAAAATLLLAAGAARAEDYVTVPLSATTINAPADVAWKKINGYCLLGQWFKTTCEITSGKEGEVGSVRTIAGRVRETLVAKTTWSYTYHQPKSPIDYHGTVEIQPIDKKTLEAAVHPGLRRRRPAEARGGRQGEGQGQPHQAVHRPGQHHEGRRRGEVAIPAPPLSRRRRGGVSEADGGGAASPQARSWPP